MGADLQAKIAELRRLASAVEAEEELSTGDWDYEPGVYPYTLCKDGRPVARGVLSGTLRYPDAPLAYLAAAANLAPVLATALDGAQVLAEQTRAEVQRLRAQLAALVEAAAPLMLRDSPYCMDPDETSNCMWCGGWGYTDEKVQHAADCRYPAFVAAMKAATEETTL